MTCDDLAALYVRAFPHPVSWRASDFRDVLATPGTFLHAEHNAFSLGRVAADEAELILIATDPANRRQGLARRCIQAFENEARMRRATIAFLEVAQSNIGARALYDAAGWEEVGQRPKYYSSAAGIAQNALILRKFLTAN